MVAVRSLMRALSAWCPSVNYGNVLLPRNQVDERGHPVVRLSFPNHCIVLGLHVGRDLLAWRGKELAASDFLAK